jgi:hypothetical protein
MQDAVLRMVLAAGFVAKKEQSAPDRSRPGDVFISRLDANGPAAVDITVRDTLAPSRPVRTAADVGSWFQSQEADKRRKYDGQCRRLGWTLVPFVMDCYGAMGDEARGLVGTALRLLLGQKEPWARRQAEASTWQGLSITLAKEVGRQLRVAAYAVAPADDDPGRGGRPLERGAPVNPGGQGRPPLVHNPYHTRH